MLDILDFSEVMKMITIGSRLTFSIIDIFCKYPLRKWVECKREKDGGLLTVL